MHCWHLSTLYHRLVFVVQQLVLRRPFASLLKHVNSQLVLLIGIIVVQVQVKPCVGVHLDPFHSHAV